MAANGGKTELVTILPTAIFGPILTTDGLGSVQIVQRLLKGTLPGIPDLGFNTVDVRDVADAHIRAMTVPEAAGQRFIAGSGWTADGRHRARSAREIGRAREQGSDTPLAELPVAGRWRSSSRK